MGLHQLLARFRADLRRPGHSSNYLARRAGIPAFAPYSNLSALLLFLDERSAETFASREAILRALLDEHRRAARVPPPTSAWAGALLVAFTPMLISLRGRLRGDALAKDELDQLVLEGFLDALTRCPLDAKGLCARLHLDTRRFVIRALVREQKRLGAARELETLATHDVELLVFDSPTHSHELDVDEQRELEELLRVVVGSAVTKERLDVVVATRLRGLPLWELSGAEGSRESRGYERLKRERSRTLELLRPLLFARLSPDDSTPALDLSRLRVAS